MPRSRPDGRRAHPTTPTAPLSRPSHAAAPSGVHVLVDHADAVVVGVGGARFRGRFLFRPAALLVGERVWLRIDRPLDGAVAAGVDVVARVAHVFPNHDGVLPATPHAGVRFTVSIDEYGAVAASEERTRGIWSAQTERVPPPAAVAHQRERPALLVDSDASSSGTVVDADELMCNTLVIDGEEPTEPLALHNSWAQTVRDMIVDGDGDAGSHLR